MTMIETQAAIVKAACFSTERVAETITYNGVEIPAIVEKGVEMARSDWNDAKTAVEGAAIADQALFSVLLTDVPDYQEGDEIISDGEKYIVSQRINLDKAGGNEVLLAVKNAKQLGR